LPLTPVAERSVTPDWVRCHCTFAAQNTRTQSGVTLRSATGVRDEEKGTFLNNRE
jgi:hypothetical protein